MVGIFRVSILTSIAHIIVQIIHGLLLPMPRTYKYDIISEIFKGLLLYACEFFSSYLYFASTANIAKISPLQKFHAIQYNNYYVSNLR